MLREYLVNNLNTTQTTFYNWIKTRDTFQRADILKQADKIGIKERTLSDILNRFINLRLIVKESHGERTVINPNNSRIGHVE
ncbi:MAG: hypothetical protein HQ474_01725 [Flammeovirgaceae bacterium]|nr:hypothetical protein [Flammeovirgaceae bacterium]